MGYWRSVAKATHMDNFRSRLGLATGRGIVKKFVNPARRMAGKAEVPIVGTWIDPNAVRSKTGAVSVKTVVRPKGAKQSATPRRHRPVAKTIPIKRVDVLTSTEVVAQMRILFDRSSALADAYGDFAAVLAENRVDAKVYAPLGAIEERLRDVARESVRQITVFRRVYAAELEAATQKPGPNIVFEPDDA